MMRFRHRIPADALAELAIVSGEKVISWGREMRPDGSVGPYLAATSNALYFDDPVVRVPWDRVAKAHWDDPVFTISMLDDSGRALPSRQVRLAISNDVPAAVFDRVTDSVIVSERIEIRPGASALMVARRGSDDDGVHWSVVFDAGLDSNDPVLRSAAQQALDQLRGSLGI